MDDKIKTVIGSTLTPTPRKRDQFLNASEASRANAFMLAINYLRTNPLLTTFLLLAIFMRILYVLVTQRTWEDALILNIVTESFWAGEGLTHQVDGPPIQSFSSVVWMLFSLLGNSIGQGLLVLKLISLLATVGTIWFAYLISVQWEIKNPGVILILGFLSFEQIQVSFGMAGMESQFATAFVLVGVWALIVEKPIVLMLTATLAPLVRPELVFWTLLVVFVYLLRPKLITFHALAISIPPVVLWVIFAVIYYGTFIPQTVTAKSLIGTTNTSKSGLLNGVTASLNSWERFTPYYSNYFATSGLISRSIGMWVVIAVVALFLAGVFRVTRLSYIWAVPALLVHIFIFYVGFFNVSNYHMWYVPPFSAVLILYAGAAFNLFPKVFVPIKYFVSCGIVFLYLIPTVSYFQHDAYVQKEIDLGVRQAAGIQLNSLMNSGETVVLEPLGFMGSEVKAGSIIDYPGLASRTMTNSLELIPFGERDMGSAVRAILPDFVVVRQGEWQSFIPSDHRELADYQLLAAIGKPSDGDLVFTGANYSNSDRYFEIYGR